MRRRLLTAALAAACAALAAALAACGSQTKTVSATEPLAAPATQAPSSTRTGTSTATKSATRPVETTSSATVTTTRTATAPAFTEKEAHAESAQAAAAVVRAHGYTPNDTGEYHPDQTLRVLVGTRTGSGDGYGQQAFFFLDGRYLGTDAKEPSASVKVVSQGDTEVVLAYPLYRSGDPLSSPSGGQRHVVFQLNNGKLTPLGQIPPLSSKTGLSRY